MTRRLYHDDSYKTELESTVIAIEKAENKYAIALEATVFYPDAGGQPPDTGSIAGLRIENTIEGGDRILHISTEKPSFRVGDTVRASIDWPRRFTNMQQHTGQHILSQAFIRALDARTVSSRLGIERSTIDVLRLNLTWEDMEKAERLSNSIVFENRPIRIYEARSDEASDLRLKKELDRDILRIVEVDGFDKSPCGGTHCRMAGEVGLIKILRWEKIRETTRVEFLCGHLARRDYFWKSRFITQLAQELTTKDANVPKIIRDLKASHRDLGRQLGQLRAELASYEIAALAEAASTIGGVRIISAYLKGKVAAETREIAKRLTEEGNTVALLASGADSVHFVFSRSGDVPIDMRKAIKTACEVVEGKGGGRQEVCEGGGRRADRAEEALKNTLETLKVQLGDP